MIKEEEEEFETRVEEILFNLGVRDPALRKEAKARGEETW